MLFHKLKILPLLICVALTAASCGTPRAQTESEIATAVAQTVQAQNSLTKVSALPTLTPVAPALPATAAPEALPTDTPGQVVSNPGCIASAMLVGEYPPDDTILLPGAFFRKTWTFLNTGTCIWDKSYSLVFWEGEQMGGLVSYPFFDIIEPNETLDISIDLQAPSAEGTAIGYWRLKTPWGVDFGVGQLNTSFYVQVGVSANPKFGITRVDYQLVRDPDEGCPINVKYIVYATVTSNGPVRFSYYWDQSDGNESGVKSYEIKEAGTATFKREWMISLNDNPVVRWIQFIETKPEYREYERVLIDHDCFRKLTPTPTPEN